MSTVSLPDPHLLSPISDNNIYHNTREQNQREQESSSGIESSVEQDDVAEHKLINISHIKYNNYIENK